MADLERAIDPRRIDYLALESLVPDPKNPKAHDFGVIDSSISRFGMVEAVVQDQRTGYLISGHGRAETLRMMETRGDSPPEGVRTDADGRWLVPVLTGWASRTDAEASAALIALNRTTELGGWVDESLLDLLSDLSDVDDGLLGVGFSDSEIDALRESLDAAADFDGESGDDRDRESENHYSRKLDAPQYVPRGESPAAETLVDTEKARELRARIAEADLDSDVEEFLLAAATRHYRFDYGRIADFYAHAPADVQRLFEESALVIVDFDDAIRNGYVRLSSRIEGLLADDLADGAEEEIVEAIDQGVTS